MDTAWYAADVVDVAAGYFHAMSIRSDGSALCIGYSQSNACVPPPLPTGVRWVMLSGSQGDSAGLRSDGTIAVWGASSRSPVPQPVPSLPPNVTYVEVDAGGSLNFPAYFLARRSDGIVVGWGSGYAGITNPPAPPAGRRYVEVAAGSSYALGLLDDGSIVTWGWAPQGQHNAPQPVPGLPFTSVCSGSTHCLAMRSDGTVVGWGDNTAGQCNVPPLPTGLRYVQITAGEWHSAALRSDGSIVVWGTPSYFVQNVPALPPGLSYLKVAAAGTANVALRSDGRAITWGANLAGFPNVPELPPGRTYRRLAQDSSGHLMALRDDGVVLRFGYEPYGPPAFPPAPPGATYVDIAIGSGHAALTSTGQVVVQNDSPAVTAPPPPLPNGTTYTDLDGGDVGFVAIRSDGDLVWWSYSGRGSVPALPSSVRYVQAAVGYDHVLALRSDGSIVAWGPRCGPECNAPVQLPGIRFTKVTAGRGFSMALRSDGSIVSWGQPQAPQPPPLPRGTAYVDVSARGRTHAVALRSDGRVVCFGTNSYGESTVPSLPEGQTFDALVAGTSVTLGLIGPVPPRYVRFALGCPGSLGTAQLLATTLPVPATSLTVHIDALPLGLALMLSGTECTTSPAGALPLALASHGMPGCSLHVRPDAATAVFGPSNAASYRLALPNHPAVLGALFYQQALVLDPQSGNQLGAVMSDAAAATVGMPW